jgi:hypothetical protein
VAHQLVRRWWLGRIRAALLCLEHVTPLLVVIAFTRRRHQAGIRCTDKNDAAPSACNKCIASSTCFCHRRQLVPQEPCLPTPTDLTFASYRAFRIQPHTRSHSTTTVALPVPSTRSAIGTSSTVSCNDRQQSHPALTSCSHLTRSPTRSAYNSFAGLLHTHCHACLPDFDGYINCPAAVYLDHCPPPSTRYIFLNLITLTAGGITSSATSPQPVALLAVGTVDLQPHGVTPQFTPTIHNYRETQHTHSRPTWRTRTLSTS